MPRRFLVLHGWQNRRPPGHWQWQLVQALRSTGEQVLYPQLPSPDRPDLAEWRALLAAELAQLGDGERVVVAHSLGALLWLHAAPDLPDELAVDRLLLVAPPSPAVMREHEEVAAFGALTPDGGSVGRSARQVRLVCSDDDPYCPAGAAAELGPLLGPRGEVDLLPGQRHLDPDAGYGTWPAAEAWCRDGATRLTARPR